MPLLPSQEEERKRREAQIKHQKAERERKQLEEEARRSEDRQRKQILKAKMAEEKQLAADEMLSVNYCHASQLVYYDL